MKKDTNKSKIHEWEHLAQKELKDKDLKDLYWKTPEGIKIKAVYTENDLLGLNHLGSLPGVEPFVRGPKATMYVGRPWTVRQYAGFSTAEESNAFYKKCLEGGQKGLSVAFDLATHRGYDSDHPRVIGDVGKAGVAIDSVEDMKTLFDGIPLDKMSVSMTMNGAVLPILATYIVAAEEQGVDKSKLSGTIQNDILKEFLVRNTYIYPPEPSMQIVSDIIAYTSKHMPKFNSISISGYHMQEAGANQVQELAFTIADGLEYVRAAEINGLSVDDFAPRLSFFFAIGMNFFMEVAKLRAARYLWAKLMKSKFSPKNNKSLMLRTHCQTSGVSLTEKDPYNNIVRTTIEAMAAVLGGTQSLHTNSFDEAVALPTETSSRIARNTQLILLNETGVTKTVDPLAGSYFVENLTNSLIVNAGLLIDRVEKTGGMTKAIEDGFPKKMIEESAATRQSKIDRGEEVVVGVNEFINPTEQEIDVFEVDNTKVRKEQIRKLKGIRGLRNAENHKESIKKLIRVAKSNKGNLLDAAIEAARNRATVGEISSALEDIYGRYDAKVTIAKGVYSKGFENSKSYEEVKELIKSITISDGKAPKMLVAKLGQDGHDRGAKVIASSFSDMGFEISLTKLFLTPEELAQEAVDKNVDIIGVSSHAAGHLTLVPEFISKLKDISEKKYLIICGGVIPQKDYDKLIDSGVSAVFGPGSNIVDAAYKVINLYKYGKGANI